MTLILDPNQIANRTRREVRAEAQGESVNVVGVLASHAGPSATYAQYTEVGCADVGFNFRRLVVNDQNVREEVARLNADASVHGILIYYPILGAEGDRELKELVSPTKDLEGLTDYWLGKLYDNIRFDDPYETRKAILPCTPLAILKLLEESLRQGFPERQVPPSSFFANTTVVIFNRSAVVGRPLAAMLSHDGARVISFDEHGAQEVMDGVWCDVALTRSEALAHADLVVTGVPSRDFPLVKADEIRASTICLNFSTLRNFAPEVAEKAAVFVPRVGPMTVTMALRNVLRLRRSYQAAQG